MMQNNDHFFELLKPHYQDAANYCRGLNMQHHEDIFQEALLKGMKGFDSLRDEGQFRSWLFRIISREAISFQRRYFWRKFTESQDGQPGDSHQAAESVDSHNLNELLTALSGLPRRKRETLLLYEIGGFSIKELSAIFGESEPAIKSRLSRTRKELADKLAAGLPPDNDTRTIKELYDEVESRVFAR